MKRKIDFNALMLRCVAACTLAFLNAPTAWAQYPYQYYNGARGPNFSDLSGNIIYSIRDLPQLISSVSYMIGLIMAMMGVLKLKDHVENPSQTAMKDGAIRLVAGGALFALPIVTESMRNTIGLSIDSVSAPRLNPIEFN
jgi:hypothetical protein